MHAPNAIQALMLQSVQNLACNAWRTVRDTYAAGYPAPPPDVAYELAINDRCRTVFEDTARLVGCPVRWIDFCRESGIRGDEWTSNRHFHDPPLDRSALLAGLGREIHALQDLAGLEAAHALRRGDLAADERAGFRSGMGMIWQRLGAVSHVLELSDRERLHLWSREGSPNWAKVVATQTQSRTDSDLATEFAAAARANLAPLAMPVSVLRRAGLLHLDMARHMPIHAEAMVELTRAEILALGSGAVSVAPGSETAAGASADSPREIDSGKAIDDAIDAATAAEDFTDTSPPPSQPDPGATSTAPGYGNEP
ncbi:hypothetical protein [Nocardia brasiliensis]|uniref:hypothetical protein n=1 Tax=Nocardia brasiliensis TaxID=37326 RepID=UPI0024561041|nr:hypothetical protein [Nocardia brasiliensis]